MGANRFACKRGTEKCQALNVLATVPQILAPTASGRTFWMGGPWFPGPSAEPGWVDPADDPLTASGRKAGMGGPVDRVRGPRGPDDF